MLHLHLAMVMLVTTQKCTSISQNKHLFLNTCSS